MRNTPSPPRSTASLSDYTPKASARSSESLRNFWESEQSVRAIWFGQVGQIFVQLLFLLLFDPLFRDYLPTMEYPDRTNFYADLFGWGTAGPVLTSLVLIPIAIGRIRSTWKSGNKWLAFVGTLALVGISWFFAFQAFQMCLTAYD